MCIRDRFNIDREVERAQGMGGSSEPVSYTHLDVYKRQEQSLFRQTQIQQLAQQMQITQQR